MFKATDDYGPVDRKIFDEWVQWKMDIENNSKSRIVYNQTDFRNEYHQTNKSSLYTVPTLSVLSANKCGSDNLGFVPDDNSQMNSFRSYSQHLDGSFRKPRLLSSRKFHDNY